MIAKSIVLLFVFFATDINSSTLDYTYDNLAGGWLKLHKAASWTDASIRCDSEGAVLVSPIDSQLRDAVHDYLKRACQYGSTIFSGVKAEFSTGDYYSVEGVSLTRMPVTLEIDENMDLSSSESCVEWKTDKAAVKIVRCDDILPFVCYKKRTTKIIKGCGTVDSEYKYNDRSGSCYKFHRKGLTWPKAYQKCKKEGAYLAIINNQLESEVLKDLFAKNPYTSLTSTRYDHAFMGIRNWLDGDSWRTVKDTTFEDSGFAVWGGGEPNNLGGEEYCISLFRDGKYNDENCNISLVFICEKKPEILYNNTP